MSPRIVYVAGPLFSTAEQRYNASLVELLSARLEDFTFILPQDFTKLLPGDPDFFGKIFRQCIDSVDVADLVLSILEGADVDSGTAVEMGYAYAKRKPIVGVRTDFRTLEEKGVNLMVARVCTEMLCLPSHQMTMEAIADEIASVLLRLP
jgi:nucleoside 2-deoxyribosyltransferase